MINIAIVQFPGSNCERETILAVKRAGMQAHEFLWNEPADRLKLMDGFILVGGFSYEDRSRAGIIAALDPVMLQIKAEATTGKPVLGICNGAQILVESGLVPGVENHKVVMALTENKRVLKNKIVGTGYYNAWVNLCLSDNYQRNAFTRYLREGELMHIPLAHGEGRFVMPKALLDEITRHGLGVFQYCDESGVVDPDFPVNPNASMNNLAAVSNKSGNVMAMMPHPERSLNGDVIFKSMRAYIESRNHQDQLAGRYSKYLDYYPRKYELKNYHAVDGLELISELIIADNHALTVEQALQNQGIAVSVKRFAHWTVKTNDLETIEAVKQSEVLLNPRKEKSISKESWRDAASQGQINILVKSKDDVTGAEKHQILRDHFGMDALNGIESGIIWQFKSSVHQPKDLLDRIVNSQIIMNASAHDSYHYEPSTKEYYSTVTEALSA